MPTTNVFEAVLGKRAVKWDAFWHLFEWLVDPNEGHGLSDTIRLKLLEFAFGESYTECIIRREYPVSGQTDGKGKWADFALGVPTLDNPTHLVIMDDIGAASSGGKRKLLNLMEFIALAQQSHPGAKIRAVAVSNAPAGTKLASVVYSTLGEEAAEFAATTGWKLLPLQTIGEWLQQALVTQEDYLSEKMKLILHELAEWCT